MPFRAIRCARHRAAGYAPREMTDLGISSDREAPPRVVRRRRALPSGRAVVGGFLVDLLAGVAERGDRVALWLRGGVTLSGRVAGVGVDVVRLDPDGPDAGPAYVSVPSILEVAVFRSG